MKRGYTLVEILMGVFILSIGLVSILGAFPVGIRIVHKIKRTTILCNFAQSKMAEYQAYASPLDTLSYGEIGGGPRNPFEDMYSDAMHQTPGTEGTRSTYGIGALAPNGQPGTGDNGEFGIIKAGAGVNLNYKISDFETYVRGFPGTYQLARPETDYGNITSSDYRMGLVQNQRRFREAYGFVSKYILEVWEGGEKTKTDPDFNANIDLLSSYYAFSTAIWNPHIFHSTEWSPVMETSQYADATFCEGQHDYFWPWNNKLEGWGYHSGSGGRQIPQDAVLAPPTSPEGAAANYPWC